MKGGLRFSLVGALVLVTLSGCGRGFFQQAQRAPWRHRAEVACMKSGAVKLGEGTVEIKPIEGPGACGMDFPLKVSALGMSSVLGYADELQPPAAIPEARSADMPRWPLRSPRYRPPREHLRWVVGPPAINAPATAPVGSARDAVMPAGAPMSLAVPDQTLGPPSGALPPIPMPTRRSSMAPMTAPMARAMPNDIPPDAIIPPGGSAAVPEGPPPRHGVSPPRRAYNAPDYQPEAQPRALPRLGPPRNYTPVALPGAQLSPPATLSCPIVSALDRWVSEGVQPAALHWFGSPVVTIKQIGSYSCRDMIGARGHHISEHAFGDALDIAGFTLADGRTITVRKGWHGSPADQGFLHDVQLYACETFNTVLAPGYNPEHYDHIHVDLMRRASGRRPCEPTAIPGEVVAARLRKHYASRRHMPAYTGSIAKQFAKESKASAAVPGADGYVAEDDDAADKTGALPAASPSTPAKHDAPRRQGRLNGIY